MRSFYRKFGSNLPQIVVVTAGFLGDVITDVFDRGEVIRLHSVSRQQRVVAKALPPVQMHISIPLTFPEQLCVLKKNGSQCFKGTVKEILEQFRLPVAVQFPENQSFSLGSQNLHTHFLDSFTLSEAFEEMYILGNTVCDGKTSKEVVHVPLYLNKLRISVCTGLKGKTKYDWLKFLEDINAAPAYPISEAFPGNPDIAFYDPKATHAENFESYSYVEPSKYGSYALIKAQINRNPTQCVSSNREDSVYDHIPEPQQPEPQPTHAQYSHISSKQKTPPPVPNKLTPVVLAKYTGSVATDGFAKKTQVYRKAEPANGLPSRATEEEFDKRPALPKRDNRPPLSTKSPNDSSPTKASGYTLYSNDIPRTSVIPINEYSNKHSGQRLHGRVKTTKATLVDITESSQSFYFGDNHPAPSENVPKCDTLSSKSDMSSVEAKRDTTGIIKQMASIVEMKLNLNAQQKRRSSLDTSTTTVRESVARDVQTHAGQLKSPSNTKEETLNTLPEVNSAEDVRKLSIRELGMYLKRLRLDRFVDRFKEDMIDGMILGGLDKEALKDEYGMREIETIRLLKFASEAHLPQ